MSHLVAMLTPMTESLRDRRKRRTAEAIVAAALELFAERGFERTTIEQIAAAADISRRTFFRYFADKEELFFAEDERLLEVVEATLDAAPAGEPVLELARRATRALAAHSVADPERRLARERLIAATPALQARRLTKNLRWEQAIAARLRQLGSGEQEALLVPKLAMACFQTAFERWVRDPGRDLPGLVDESFAALGGIAG
jgi:AcrR family transcriptional regulator